MGVLDYDQTPGNNTSINGIGIQGTSVVQNFDNALRQYMADMASYVTRRATKAANYTAVKADNHQLIEFTAAATLSLSAAATLGDGWTCMVRANGGDVVIDPNSSETINGATTLTLKDGNGLIVFCNGTAFFTMGTLLPNDASSARSNIAAQAYHDKLQNFSGLTGGANRLPYFDGTDTLAQTQFTAFGRSLIDDVDAAMGRATMGVRIGTDVQAYDADTAKTDEARTWTATQEFLTATSIKGSVPAGSGQSNLGFEGSDDVRIGYVGVGGADLDVRLVSDSGNVILTGTVVTAKNADFRSDRFRPVADNNLYLGDSTRRWITVYAVNGSINTSDANEKKWRGPLSATEMAVAKELSSNIGIFQWLSVIANEGEETARLHIGVTAQDVRSIFESHGLDASRYGVWCLDTWTDEEGVAHQREGIRYNELLMWIAAGFNARLDAAGI